MGELGVSGSEVREPGVSGSVDCGSGVGGSGAQRLVAGAPRRLSVPRRIAVEVETDGRPRAVGGRPVDTIRETWLIEDRWWTERPLRRRYWEVVTLEGRNEVIFHDLLSGRWWCQR